MDIREFQNEDLRQVLNIGANPSKRREDKFLQVGLSRAFYCFVAEEENEIKGFIIMEDLADGISHYMTQINVAEKRKGIGTKLVEKVFEYLGPGSHISLCVNTDNEPAKALYESMGFVKAGFTTGYRKGQDKDWYTIDL